MRTSRLVSDLLDSPLSYLCHYTSAESAFAHILSSGKLRMNSYRSMRDPFENKEARLSAGLGRGPERDDFIERFAEVEREVGRARDRYCLMSLTRGDDAYDGPSMVRFSSPWSRARMWEQYADAHAGVCLVFDQTELIRAAEAALHGGELWHQPVTYTPAGFARSRAATMTVEPRGKSIEDHVRDHVARHYEDFFFLKTDDWATEFEYRFVWRRADEDLIWKAMPPLAYVPYGAALRYVILGERFPDWLLPSAERAALDRGAELRRMDWDRGPYPRRLTPETA